MSNGSVLADAACARLCHIIKWDDFDGYGFNLHAEKTKPGQYIGKVDEDSPAEAAGLKQGDRIVEVNGVNICNENHKQVVERIKAVPDETKLLVVDKEADEYYQSKSIVITSTLPNVQHLKTPEHSKMKLADKVIHRDAGDVYQETEHSIVSAKNETNKEKTSGNNSSNATTPLSEHKHSLVSSPEPSQNESPSVAEGAPPSSNGNVSSSLNLNMTAAELRAQLAARKKYDPRKENIDLRHKFDIIQTL